MKVLLIKDVFKLGHAGDVKKVANGYGRNYLIPQGLAVLATPAALKQTDRIRKGADEQRMILNQELGGIAEKIQELKLTFAAKAGETGKLYGSITPQMIADAVNEQLSSDINRRQIESQPIRTIGIHKSSVRLTIDLNPEITVLVHREGESASSLEEAIELASIEESEDAPMDEILVEETETEENIDEVENFSESDEEISLPEIQEEASEE